MYDHVSAFDEFSYIDWRQTAKYGVGEIVYIYATKPYMKVNVHFADSSSVDLGEVPDEIKVDKQLIYEHIMVSLNDKNVDLHNVLIDSVNIDYVYSN